MKRRILRPQDADFVIVDPVQVKDVTRTGGKTGKEVHAPQPPRQAQRQWRCLRNAHRHRHGGEALPRGQPGACLLRFRWVDGEVRPQLQRHGPALCLGLHHKDRACSIGTPRDQVQEAHRPASDDREG